MRISDWSSDVCSSDLVGILEAGALGVGAVEDRAEEVGVAEVGAHQDRARQIRARHLGAAQPGALQREAGEVLPRQVRPDPAAPLAEPSLVLLEHAHELLRRHAVVPEVPGPVEPGRPEGRSEEHKSELQSLMRTSYAAFWLYKKK